MVAGSPSRLRIEHECYRSAGLHVGDQHRHGLTVHAHVRAAPGRDATVVERQERRDRIAGRCRASSRRLRQGRHSRRVRRGSSTCRRRTPAPAVRSASRCRCGSGQDTRHGSSWGSRWVRPWASTVVSDSACTVAIDLQLRDAPFPRTASIGPSPRRAASPQRRKAGRHTKRLQAPANRGLLP